MKLKAASKAEGINIRKVHFILAGRYLSFAGNWQWEMETVEIICSDVFFAPTSLDTAPVTRCLIHPDDAAGLKDVLAQTKEKEKVSLQFRVITSYGQVKDIKGSGPFIINAQEQYLQEVMQHEAAQSIEEAQIKKMWQKQEVELKAYRYADQINAHSIWYINTSTGEIFYSDQVYRIYGLPAQSLNAHYHTFTQYIHPDDRELYIDYFDKAYKEQLPLQLEFRVVLLNGEERYLRQSTHWVFSDSGELVLIGVVEDNTALKEQEQQAQETRSELYLKEKMLQQAEAETGIASWHLNLLTRKIVYSDAIYRIYCIKLNSVLFSSPFLMNMVHPDDAALVREANRKMLFEHVVETISYRIIRTDGTIRYLKQYGRTIINAQNEIIVLGLTQDMTVMVQQTEKLQGIEQQYALHRIAQKYTEEQALLGTWVLEVSTGKSTWSPGIYTLMGLRTGAIEINQKIFSNYIHTGDRAEFNTRIHAVLNGNAQQDELTIKMQHKGGTRFVKVGLQLLTTDEEKQVLLATFQNRTEEHLVQQQLQQQQLVEEVLNEHLADCVIITDANNYIQKWNKSSEEKYGIKKEKAIGRNLFDVLPQLATPEFLKTMHNVLNGETVSLKNEYSVPFREYHDILMVPIGSHDEEVSGVLTILHNTTKETELKHQLTNRIQFIERLLAATVDRIVVLDRNMNYLYWNKRAEDYYGLNKEDVIGKNILELSPSFVDDPSYTEFKKALKGEVVHIPANKNLELKKGYFETYLIPIKDDNGQVTAVLWIVHDLLKELQLLQQQRKANDLLNSINEAYIEVDSDGIIRFVNHKVEEILDTRREELIGTNLAENYTQLIGQQGYEVILKALYEGAKQTIEYYFTETGQWIYLSATPTTGGVVVLFYNNSEIIKARKELEDEHRRLKEAQALGHTGSFEWNAASDTIFLSDEMYRIYGLEPQSEKMTLERLVSLVHPDDREMFLEKAMTLRQQTFSGAFVHRIIRTDGEVRILMRQYQSYADETGKVMHYTGVAQDITERIYAEEALNEMYQHVAKSAFTIQRMLDGSIVAICLLESKRNEAGKIIDFIFNGVNKAAEQILKKPADELMGKGLLESFLGMQAEYFDQYVQVVETGETYRAEQYFNFENLNNWFDVSVVKNEDGLILTFMDVTAQKKVEQELQESKLFVEQIMQATPDFIMVFNLQTNKTDFVNRTAYKDDEHRYRETLLINYEQILERAHPDDREGLHQFIDGFRTAPDNYIKTFDYRVVKGTEEVWYRARGKVFKRNAEGQPTHYISVVQDITSIKATEEKMQELNQSLEKKNQELVSKNEELKSFAFVASHDLKEPLRKLHLFSNWIQEKEETLSSTGKDHLKRMDEAVKHLEAMVEDVFTLTGIELNINTCKAVDLNVLLNKLKKDLSATIKESGTTIENSSLPVVKGDASYLFILLKNLICNSIKFKKAGTPPVISIKADTVNGNEVPNGSALQPDQQYNRIAISDNGIGFAQQHAEKIFQLFQRLHSKTDYSGTGIGLTICKKIMEHHNGFIVAESAGGNGATFYLYFPV